MHTAKELHDGIKENGMVFALSSFGGPETILRALSLLASVEDSKPVAWIEHHKGGDNVNWDRVDHPYAKATPLFKHPPLLVEDEDGIVRELRRMALPDPHDEREVPHAGLCRRAAALIVSQRQEIERVKAHAEAMANSHDNDGNYVSLASAISAYRAAHPKDAP